MKINKIYMLLSLIVFLGFFLRFYQLGSNPPSLTWDEAAWGYNAYSLGIDGRDEFGRFLPLDYLESFGDFKPPIYAYLDILPVKIFGLNEFAVRFPSALLGVLTVLVTYFLTKRIFWSSKSKGLIAMFSSLFLAISPWHVMLSRAAFEANVATFFIACGVWLFLGAVQDKKWYLVLSAISFSISLYTFNTARVFVPIIVIFLAFIFRTRLFDNKKQTIVAILVGILLILPTFKFLLSPQASLRFKEVNIFSDIEIIKTSNQQIENDKNSFWSKIIHNRRFAYSVEYLRHYLDNFNPSFLFIKGDGNPKFSTQTVGQMYLWDLPFFVVGILFLFKKKMGYWWIIPIWLLVGVVPAATARETPHALRIETTLPTFQILVAFGFYQFLEGASRFIKKVKLRRIVIVGVLFFLFVNFLYFMHDYSAHYRSEFSGEWQYGYKESVSFVKSVKNNYDVIFITNALGRPYIYYLFYEKIDPAIFRKASIVKRDAFGFVTVESLNKYKFVDSASEYYNNNKNSLFVDVSKNVPSNASKLKTINLLNGDVSLVVYE